MVNTSKIIYWSVIFAFALVGVFSCTKDDTQSTARLQIRLTDAPGDYQAVYINIKEVQVNAADTSDGWQTLPTNSGMYDLLKLTGGLDTLLADVQLPAGRISQLRLILGDGNSVKVGDTLIPLTTPSAQQSGLKVQINSDLQAGGTYKILLDFDAAHSLVTTGNGKIILKPVIRSVVEALSGSIQGTIDPVASRPAVYVVQGQDTIASTFADSTFGKFLLKGLSPGVYTLDFAPATGYLPTSKDSVSVTLGSVTDVGTIVISQ